MRMLSAAVLAGLPLMAVPPDSLEQARKLYQQTGYQESLKLLEDVREKDGAVLELMGRDFYGLGEYKRATEELEKAVAAEPENSGYALWLGRAFGRRAENDSPFAAPGHASKARQNFELAVKLDPHNRDALSDLFEYYLQAPGFMGGGIDKAAAVARQIAALDPIQGHVAEAKLAEKRKDFAGAEQHHRRAAQLAPGQPGRLIDLATFLARQGRYDESEVMFQSADKLSPGNPELLYARAELYVQQKRNLDQARQLLHRYLEAQLTPDNPPRAAAQKLLEKAGG
jgi:Flp pilus assembly protein TadD